MELTPYMLSKKAHSLSEEDIYEAVLLLLDKQKAELTDTLSHQDYTELYNEAKDNWKRLDMSVRGCSKEIQECMWQAFEKAGVNNVHSKKEFLSLSRYTYNRLDIKKILWDVMQCG